MNEKEIEDFVDLMLEGETFEELLERFDITPYEAFQCLYDNGLININELKELIRH